MPECGISSAWHPAGLSRRYDVCPCGRGDTALEGSVEAGLGHAIRYCTAHTMFGDVYVALPHCRAAVSARVVLGARCLVAPDSDQPLASLSPTDRRDRKARKQACCPAVVVRKSCAIPDASNT